MLALVAALMAATQSVSTSTSVDLGRTAWIFSTVGQSEFCPAGNVTVDLRTGVYTLTPRAPRGICYDVGLERPSSKGRLSGHSLAALRAAYLRVLSEGFEKSVCRDGGRPQDIIFDTGGTPILVLTNGRGTRSAPDDLSCWSAAASALHDILDEAFRSFHQR
jgi:hypothetical protein